MPLASSPPSPSSGAAGGVVEPGFRSRCGSDELMRSDRRRTATCVRFVAQPGSFFLNSRRHVLHRKRGALARVTCLISPSEQCGFRARVYPLSRRRLLLRFVEAETDSEPVAISEPTTTAPQQTDRGDGNTCLRRVSATGVEITQIRIFPLTPRSSSSSRPALYSGRRAHSQIAHRQQPHALARSSLVKGVKGER